MIIKETEVVTILQHICHQLLDTKSIVISHMNMEIEEYITAQGIVKYHNVDTKIKVIARIECQPTKIIIRTKGVIKYGFITLDFNTLVKEYLKENAYIQVTEEGMVVKNDYVQAIRYGKGQIEIELR